MTQESAKPIKINRTQPEVFVYRLIGENPLTRILVTSRKLELEGAEAWETFEVSSAIKDWFSSSRSQLSLQIVCSNCDFVFKSVTSSQEIPFSHRVPPHLAVLELGLSRRSGRSKRNVRHTRKSPLDCTRGKRTKRCCRYKMKVSFHSIPLKGTGWESIIEPKEFDAFVCKGKCNKRSKSILNTHALLQNRLRRVKKSEIPRLCCTSKKTKTIGGQGG
ncbi:bone morphogenetic protein 4-like [Tachypleus tridentatus]|uniref:bone morphogenetic protein 4-like n=1 Tax=Tachypleus tridentatus TaxID=6853 RepID=UPI003FD41597